MSEYQRRTFKVKLKKEKKKTNTKTNSGKPPKRHKIPKFEV